MPAAGRLAPMNRPTTLAAARALLAGYVEQPISTQTVPLAAALGRILPAPLIAPMALPGFAAAAMDGYALRQADLASSQTTLLPVSQTLAAGSQPRAPLQRGTAARIMTGAALPEGADRVVMQEHALLLDGRVRISAPQAGKPHIRHPGEDLTAGSQAIPAGQRLGPGHIALLAALGQHEVSVRRRPRVALLSTGDELCEVGTPLEPGQIHDSNRPMLLALLLAAGAEVSDIGILPDDPDRILHQLAAIAPEHDMIVSSGGASEGFADHLTRAVARRGCLEFWKLDMRPGKPVGFGDIDHCPMLILPGNPFAAAAGFALLGRVLLDRLAGADAGPDVPLRLPFAARFDKPAGRTQVLAGRLVADGPGGMTMAQPLEKQGSASLTALAGCNALIVLGPERVTVLPGDPVDVHPFHLPF